MSSYVSQGNEYDIFTIVSNFALLLPATEAAVQYSSQRAEFYLVFIAVIFYVETIVSLLYHTCKSYDVCIGFGFYVWHEFDHFFATSMIWMAVVYLLWIPAAWQLVLAMLGMLAVGIILGVSTHYNTSPGTAISVFAAIAIAGFLLYLCWYAWKQKLALKRDHLPSYRWPELLIATLLLTYATVLFTVQNYWPAGYWAVHANWHCMAAIGWTYLLLSKLRIIKKTA